MPTDDMAVALRPRNEWEAIDLGLALARAWFAPLATAWVVAYVAPALLLVAVSPWPFAAAGIAWLLRPWAERALLEVLAARCFHRRLTLAAAMRAVVRAPLRPGPWLASISWRRLSAVRLAWLAIWQLEGLRGAAARARLDVLTARGRGACAWSTLLGVAATGLIAMSGVLMTLALVPDGTGADALAWLDGSVPLALRKARTWALVLVAADALCAPWVLAAQFGWYISRRTELEAWDIELVFRALTRRVAGLTVLLLALCAAVAETSAQAPPPASFDANAAVDAILARPEFGREDVVHQWRLRRWSDAEPEPPSPWLVWLLERMPALAAASRGVMWAVALAAVGWLVGLALRRQRRKGATHAEAAAPPVFERDADVGTGDVRVVSAALHAIEHERLLDALALLYRGALAICSERGVVDVRPGDTEGDYLRQVHGRLTPDAERAVRDVVRAWQAAAYARRLPTVGEARSMCDAYQRHVARGDA